jgi:hypothetical protein
MAHVGIRSCEGRRMMGSLTADMLRLALKRAMANDSRPGLVGKQ